MKKLFDWAGVLLAVTISLIAFVGLLLFLWHVEDATPWAKMGPADWGTWAGAIGTVATLAGTIWLATESNRQRRREQIDLALVSAAQFGLWTVAVQNALRSAHRVLVNTELTPDPRPVLMECGEIIAAAGIWTSNDLAPLVVIPNHAAAKLAVVKVKIENASISLTKTGESGRPLQLRVLEKYVATITRQLTTAMDDLVEPHDDCLAFLKKHGFEG